MKVLSERAQNGSPIDPVPLLTAEDLSLVRSELLNPKEPLARRVDLISLHDRILRMHVELGESLTSAVQGGTHSPAVAFHGETLDKSVNRIEAFLRIELPEVLAASAVRIAVPPGPKRGTSRRIVNAIAVLIVGILFGSAFSDELQALAPDGISSGQMNLMNLLQISSPIGSRGESSIQLD